MNIAKVLLYILLLILVIVVLAYFLQARLIFFPGKLHQKFVFQLQENDEEVFLSTSDEETINGLFFEGNRPEVILYFHGNAGDLSGWQTVAHDFTQVGYNFFIIDYRSYGKSTGTITEKGLYKDAIAAYNFLVNKKKFNPENIIIYGRSIGTGVAVELATQYQSKGLVLESPFSSLKTLGNQKMPYLLPSLILKFHFNNLEKINNVQCPILFIHGDDDDLIPYSHTQMLFDGFKGKKKFVLIKHGGHNDLNTFQEYQEAISSLSDFL